MIRNTLISLIILVLIFPTIPYAQVQAAPLFVTIAKEIAKASLAAVGSEVGKSAIDYFKNHFNKNKEIADKFGKPQLKKGKIANNKRVWSLSPTGSLKKEDIDELAKILKSIDNNTDQEISAKIGNNNQIIISTQSGKVVIGNDTTNVNISGEGNATNIGSAGQSGGITAQTVNVTILEPKATDSKPVLFRMNDPNLIFVRKYIIPKNIGATFMVGDGCPSAPCFVVRLAEIHTEWSEDTMGTKIAPHVMFSIGGNWDGIHGVNALGQRVMLKEGCGARVSTGYYDFIFEIINDHMTTLEAWATVFPGTLEKGQTQLRGICN